MTTKVLVTGAGGFIGSHLARFLQAKGYWVRGVDIKRPLWSPSAADEFWLLDLRDRGNCFQAVQGMDQVYALAANMGGIGFISHAHADIIADNTAINANTLHAAYQAGVGRILLASSACVYPVYRQGDPASESLKERDAYPAMPEAAYGWEKLHAEHLFGCYDEAGWIETRVARLHNVYGPDGSWNDGREKAPAAICRKMAVAKLAGDPEIEVWGDGEQRRSFMYVKDCLEGLHRLMQGDYSGPVNLGRDRSVTINQLVDIVARIAGVKVVKVHDLDKPQGVRGRNSDNTLCRELLGWSPGITLEEGLTPTFEWVLAQVEEDQTSGK